MRNLEFLMQQVAAMLSEIDKCLLDGDVDAAKELLDMARAIIGRLETRP